MLRVGVESNPTNLDPRVGGDVASNRVHQLVYSSLLRFNERMELEPDLAVGMPEVVEGGRELRVRLREGVRFHDGRELTAADVVYTYESLRQEGFRSTKKSLVKDFVEITATDPRTVLFRLEEPLAPALERLTLGIVPEPGEGQRMRLADEPLGSGPYRFVSWTQDSEVVLRRNEDYYGAKARNAGVVLTIVPDPTIRLLALEMGVIDLVCNNFPAEKFLEFQEKPGFQTMAEQGTNYRYLGFNMKDSLVGRKEVRRAIALAIDRESIIRHLLQGFALPARSVFPEQHWAANPNLPEMQYDPAQARLLLEQAGFPDPDGEGPATRFRVEYKTSTDPTANRIAEVIQQQLRAVGIDMAIQSYEWATFYEHVQQGNFQIFSLTWVGVSEPDFFYDVFHSGSLPPNGRNRGRYANPEVDRLLEQARRELDREQRRMMYWQVQEILADELPYVSFWFEKNRAILREGWTGFVLYPTASLVSVAQVAPQPTQP